MPVVLLVRHGQASFGADDYDNLSDLGREQSTAVGTVLADSPPEAHQTLGSPGTVAVADSPSSDSHGTAGHLWTLCLAVLAAALAVLLAVLLPHLRIVARLALPLAQARLRSLSPLRPPDLSELCLLRI